MAKPHFRLLITGSRSWTDDTLIRLLLTKLYGEVQDRDPIMVHGTASGVDEIASKIWLELGGAVEPHPANWSEYGRSAGYIRNKEMVDAGANICFAFIKDESAGASHCARIAEASGIHTVIITDGASSNG